VAKTLPLRIAANLRALLADRSMRQQELADILGVAQGTVSRYLAASRTPRVVELERIAEVFGITIGELCDSDAVGGAAQNGGQHTVSPAPLGDAGSRERLDGPAAYASRAAS
jgi:transcriptional regulator with XRE-family HTH domain